MNSIPDLSVLIVKQERKRKKNTIQHKCSNKDLTGDNGNLSSNANPHITEDSLKEVMDKPRGLKSWGKKSNLQRKWSKQRPKCPPAFAGSHRKMFGHRTVEFMREF